MPFLRTAATVVLLLTLAACSGIGDGNRPENIRIAQDVSLEEETSVKAFTCLTAPLTLIGTFSDGGLGDFSGREGARWTSDDPSVVRVTNVGDPVSPDDPESDDVYTRGGILIPQGEGTTTVRAEFFGLTASTTVNVLPATDLRIEPAVARVVPNSFRAYNVIATIEGEERNVTALTTLSFVAPNDEVAILGPEAGLITVRGLEAGAPLEIQAEFEAPCANPPPLAQVQVAEVPDGGLRLDYEEGFDNRLAELTSEFLRLTAQFGDLNGNMQVDADETQELNGQIGAVFGYDVDGDGRCELSAEDPGTVEMPNASAPISFGGLFGSGQNLIAAVSDTDTADRSTVLCASFGVAPDPDGEGPLAGRPGAVSNPLALTVVDRALGDFTLSARVCETANIDSCEPLTLESTTPPNAFAASVEEGSILRFEAQGSFGDYIQKLTRDVNWTSSATTLASIVTGRTASAGATQIAADVSEVEACETAAVCMVTITATFTRGTTEITDDAIKTVALTLTPRPEEP